MSKIINVTEDFRIIQESNQYSIQQWATIDPTKAPKFNPEKHSAEIRQEWRDISGYYGLNMLGLSAAIRQTIVLEAGLNGSEEMDLKEYLDVIQSITKKVDNIAKKLA